MIAKKTAAASPPKEKKEKAPRVNAAQTPPEVRKRIPKADIKFPPSADEKKTFMAKLDEFGVEALCDAIRMPLTLVQISNSLGICQSTLCDWMSATPERSARIKAARIATAQHWDAEATELISKARTPFQLAKAKELAHHFRWRAAKIDPKDYGSKLAIGGASDLPPVQSVAKLDVSGLSTEALTEIMRAKDAAR